jgi:hypothetical protein
VWPGQIGTANKSPPSNRTRDWEVWLQQTGSSGGCAAVRPVTGELKLGAYVKEALHITATARPPLYSRLYSVIVGHNSSASSLPTGAPDNMLPIACPALCLDLRAQSYELKRLQSSGFCFNSLLGGTYHCGLRLSYAPSQQIPDRV